LVRLKPSSEIKALHQHNKIHAAVKSGVDIQSWPLMFAVLIYPRFGEVIRRVAGMRGASAIFRQLAGIGLS
jgi:hypothetical protein